MLHTTPPDPAALARRPDPAGPLAVATPTTRRLADASISRNTRRAYLGALARLDAWRGPAPVDDPLLAVYLGAIFEAGRAPATAALAVAAVRFRAKLAGQPAPAGEATARVLGGYRRTAAPLRADGLAAILATAERPRTDGRGVESHTTAHRRGRLDAVIASLLFMGGLRRSEVSALEWRDVSDARDGDGVLLTVRTSKTNQEGDAADVRYLKNGAAKAIRTLRAAAGDKHTRLRNQMRRLFGCTVSLLYEDARGEATLNAPIARLTEFWWSERQPDARSLWESKIELGEDFFNEIIRCPIPIDLNTLHAMKRSPLGLDLYLWLTYRTFGLTRPLRLTWPLLYRQFGVDPARAGDKLVVNDFRKDCLARAEENQGRVAGPALLDG